MIHDYYTVCVACGEPRTLVFAHKLSRFDLVPWTCKACGADQAYSTNAQTKLTEW